MEMSLLLSMAGFALAMSISPGPVNLVALSAGAQYGFRASLRHVVGATLGFILLLLLMGLGLGAVLSHWPVALGGIRWGGILFLCYMAWLLMMDSGEIESEGGTPPAFLYGALMQWLNPKAWLAASMGMGAYVSSCLQAVLLSPHRLRWFNRAMAMLLLLSAGYLVLEP
ncbi:amino acid transporter LysE [Aeromonas salmonicida]|uniref:LysE family translocator n=1 Tax=Aeromonas salmonicida TaxID=645 RepID=UPI000E13EED7|nr:LysE family transporter [Aeromonas salmonicida]SUU73506.1 amino acid transporter LysE [Aeromonas salmonicida]